MQRRPSCWSPAGATEARALWARVLSEEAVEANLRQARKARARFER
jgi:hypothetical protein